MSEVEQQQLAASSSSAEEQKEEEEQTAEDEAQDGTGLKKQRFIPEYSETKDVCFNVFKCKSPKFDVRSFSILDKQSIFGFICKRDGPIGGSLYVVSVNGQSLKDETTDKREFIYATPKLKYAYNKSFDNYVEKFEEEEKIDSYYISEKWNGTNILLFKYHDKDGNEYISGKTKGMPTLTDTDFGNFLSSTLTALHLDQFIGKYEELSLRDELLKIHNDTANPHYSPHIQEFLNNPSVQCISFEVCGNTLPHLVKYEFGVDLKPLFYGFSNGKIKPCMKVKGMEEFGPIKYYPYQSHASCVKLCKMLQADSLKMNEEYRKQHNLKHKYEYEHFAIEGHVLYLLDSEGYLVTRNMYKVKSADVEEVHWQKFDDVKKGQVKDAVLKMKQRGLSLTDEKALRKELDIGDKEWGKFSKDILNYIKQLGDKSTPVATTSTSNGKKPSKHHTKAPATQKGASSSTEKSESTTSSASSSTATTTATTEGGEQKQPNKRRNHHKKKQAFVKKEAKDE
ncbi:predicted protein [Naegleria gruberi]|uniref:Predicted protein n=1 Tax=Naegleria gruberi TaxID=5762 RepID=D2VU81_NAEGR|nr:uncharacterized protein NAEGRDRAFT_59229 [Naegleria gruberi]EFC39643.1 predicted protein [Naegleria gruberi]|eukprot:XP_002672387.1 predicted protein [Naegleria gruberi strain NEG-M]